jgi:hypothetical protein
MFEEPKNNEGYDLNEISEREAKVFKQKIRYGLMEAFLGVDVGNNNMVAAIDINAKPEMIGLNKKEHKELLAFLSSIDIENDSVLEITE